MADLRTLCLDNECMNVPQGGSGGSVVGAIQMFAGATAPTGWLICDGSAISREDYADLFDVIGTTFGTGDGITTFNLPSFVNRMPIGSGDLYADGSVGGSKDAVVVSHNHSQNSHSHAPGAGLYYLGSNGDISVNQVKRANAAESSSGRCWVYGGSTSTSIQEHSSVASTTASNNPAGVSGSDANLPPYLGINFIIFAGV